jgi:opacity protein-like surface antigen
MLLTTFITFTALGFGIWILGHLLYAHERSGTLIAIASLGAVIIMATGGAVALSDVEQQTGELIEKDYAEFNGSNSNATVVNNQTHVSYERSRVSITDDFGAAFGQLGLGGLQMIVGALLMIRDLEEVSF